MSRLLLRLSVRSLLFPVGLRGTSFVPVISTVTFPTMSDQTAVSSIAILQPGEKSVFMDSLCTCITYLINLVVRWEGSFCYCCSSSHRKVALFHKLRQPTIISDKSSFQLFIVATFFIINRFSFKHDRLFEYSIFECRCCIQLRTSSSSSTSLSFRSPPSRLNLFPFHGCYFFFLLDPLTDSFSINFEFLCCTVDRIFLSVFNSDLFKLYTIILASFSLVGYCLIFANVIHHFNK